MNYYEIPLTPTPQTLSIMLAGRTWNATVYWNDICERWILDLADSDQVPVVTGLTIVAGVDILGQFKHLNIGGSLVVQTDSNGYMDPGFENLGLSSRLIFVTE